MAAAAAAVPDTAADDIHAARWIDAALSRTNDAQGEAAAGKHGVAAIAYGHAAEMFARAADYERAALARTDEARAWVKDAETRATAGKHEHAAWSYNRAADVYTALGKHDEARAARTSAAALIAQ